MDQWKHLLNETTEKVENIIKTQLCSWGNIPTEENPYINMLNNLNYSAAMEISKKAGLDQSHSSPSLSKIQWNENAVWGKQKEKKLSFNKEKMFAE